MKGRIGTAVPDLATSWEQSTDGLSWTFTLRDGILFSDDVEFSCADVAWMYNTIRTGDGLDKNPRSAHFSVLNDVTCADDLTAVFHLDQAEAVHA